VKDLVFFGEKVMEIEGGFEIIFEQKEEEK